LYCTNIYFKTSFDNANTEHNIKTTTDFLNHPPSTITT